MKNAPLETLRHHVTGAIERGDAVAIVEQRAAHTAGPWTYHRMRMSPADKDRRSGFVVNGPDNRGADLPVRICDLRVPQGIDGYREGEANARLIAAAPMLPEMAEALHGMLNWARRVKASNPGMEVAAASAILAQYDKL